MRTFKIKITFFVVALTSLLFLEGCKKDFASTNTNPSNVTQPEIKFLLTYAEEKITEGHTNEWVYEGFEQLLRYSQHVTTNSAELFPSINTRYPHYYSSILPNLFEIRQQIDVKEDKVNYAKMAAVTHVLQVLYGIRVTDLNGSMPYAQAIKGRAEGILNPVFDDQKTLFSTWLAELNSSIADLSVADNLNTKSFGNSDIFYKSDWSKWIKLANTLKLKIAARYENQDKLKTAEIAKEVLSNSYGPLQDISDNLQYSSPTNNGVGGDINYRAIKYGSIAIIDFMKKVNDPRLMIYFSPNDLVNSYLDTIKKYSVTLPDFINTSDPMVQFQGAPTDLSRVGVKQKDFVSGNTFNVSASNKYNLISTINRRFFSPRYDGSQTGKYTELIVGAAESCLLVAEFVKKGYAPGDAMSWYKKGVTASIVSMNNIATAAGSTTAFSGDGSAKINAYLLSPLIILGDNLDLEKIYAQEHLNLIREPNEAYVFSRRTGYPSFSSSYFPREPFSENIARRFWIDNPGEVNRANWADAYTKQGFTQNTRSISLLEKERVWYDITAPKFGEGK